MLTHSDDEVVRLLRVLVKFKIQEAWAEKNQKEIIVALGRLGCSSLEISELLGVSKNNVAPVLSRARKAPGKAPKERKAGARKK